MSLMHNAYVIVCVLLLLCTLCVELYLQWAHRRANKPPALPSNWNVFQWIVHGAVWPCSILAHSFVVILRWRPGTAASFTALHVASLYDNFAVTAYWSLGLG